MLSNRNTTVDTKELVTMMAYLIARESKGYHGGNLQKISDRKK